MERIINPTRARAWEKKELRQENNCDQFSKEQRRKKKKQQKNREKKKKKNNCKKKTGKEERG